MMEKEQLSDYTGRWINEEHKIDIEIRDNYTVLFYKLGDYLNILTYYLDYQHGNELSLVGDKILIDYSLTHKSDELTLKQHHKGKCGKKSITLIKLTKMSHLMP